MLNEDRTVFHAAAAGGTRPKFIMAADLAYQWCGQFTFATGSSGFSGAPLGQQYFSFLLQMFSEAVDCQLWTQRITGESGRTVF
jgi:hypothetical protein